MDDDERQRAAMADMLAGSGFEAQFAADGQEALERLTSFSADVIVSDLVMPRMDGFELTAKIRADPRLADLPVVLVTALASREDRERGVEAGANAYIVKSSFDQSNLLETIRRLL